MSTKQPTIADVAQAVAHLRDAVAALTTWAFAGSHSGELGNVKRQTDASLSAVDAALAGHVAPESA
jgi:hypothetical protein